MYEGDDLKRVLFVLSNTTAVTIEKQLSKDLQTIVNDVYVTSGGLITLNKAFWIKDFSKF